MGTKVVVLVADQEDQKRGEITLFDTPTEAERHVEALLDSGLEQKRLRILAGAEVDPQVSKRCVVSLPIDNGNGAMPPGNRSGRAGSVFATGAHRDERTPLLKAQADHLPASEGATSEGRLSDRAPIESVPPMPEKPQSSGRHRFIGAAG